MVSKLKNHSVVFWIKTLVFSGCSTGQIIRQLNFTSLPIIPWSMLAILFKDTLISYILKLATTALLKYPAKKKRATQLYTAVQPSHQWLLLKLWTQTHFLFQNQNQRLQTVHVPPLYNFLMHLSHQFHWSGSNCDQIQQREASHIYMPSIVGLKPQLITTGLHLQSLICVGVGLFVRPCLHKKSFLQLSCQSFTSTNNPFLKSFIRPPQWKMEYSKQQQLSEKDFHHSS